MTKNSDSKTSVTVASKSRKREPTPSRIDLRTTDDIRLEMARVYREMRNNVIDAQQGTRLVYVLSAIGKLIEIHEIEKRIELLEAGETGRIGKYE